MREPRLGEPIAPPTVVWVSLSADSAVQLENVEVTLHHISRDKALVQAGAWRKFLLKGLFSDMSEPRPWMNFNDKSPIREQLETIPSFAKRRVALVEVLETVEVARQLLPDDDIVRQYHDWVYQNIDRQNLNRLRYCLMCPVRLDGLCRFVNRGGRCSTSPRGGWTTNGEFGGYPDDDTDLYQGWVFADD